MRVQLVLLAVACSACVLAASQEQLNAGIESRLKREAGGGLGNIKSRSSWGRQQNQGGKVPGWGDAGKNKWGQQKEGGGALSSIFGSFDFMKHITTGLGFLKCCDGINLPTAVLLKAKDCAKSLTSFSSLKNIYEDVMTLDSKSMLEGINKAGSEEMQRNARCIPKCVITSMNLVDSHEIPDKELLMNYATDVYQQGEMQAIEPAINQCFEKLTKNLADSGGVDSVSDEAKCNLGYRIPMCLSNQVYEHCPAEMKKTGFKCIIQSFKSHLDILDSFGFGKISEMIKKFLPMLENGGGGMMQTVINMFTGGTNGNMMINILKMFMGGGGGGGGLMSMLTGGGMGGQGGSGGLFKGMGGQGGGMGGQRGGMGGQGGGMGGQRGGMGGQGGGGGLGGLMDMIGRGRQSSGLVSAEPATTGLIMDATSSQE